MCAYGVRSVFESESIREALIGKLSDEGIRFHLDDDGAICYSMSDDPAVDLYVREFASSLRPPPTQLAIPGRNYALAVMGALESEGIAFKSAENDGELVVTLERDEDVEAAYVIVRRVGTEQFNIQVR